MNKNKDYYKHYYYCVSCGKGYRPSSKEVLNEIKDMCDNGGFDDHFHIRCSCGSELIVDCRIQVRFLSDKDRRDQNTEAITSALIKKESQKAINLINNKSQFSILKLIKSFLIKQRKSK